MQTLDDLRASLDAAQRAVKRQVDVVNREADTLRELRAKRDRVANELTQRVYGHTERAVEGGSNVH